MSISPPTDIILDVARAADPVRYQEAPQRLSRLSATTIPADGFSDALKAAGPPPRTETVDATEAMNRMRSTPASRTRNAGANKAAKANEGFEAVALTSF